MHPDIDNNSSSFSMLFLRDKKTFSHIKNEFVPTRLRKDVGGDWA